MLRAAGGVNFRERSACVAVDVAAVAVAWPTTFAKTST